MDICRIIWHNKENGTYRLFNFTNMSHLDIEISETDKFGREADIFDVYCKNVTDFKKSIGENANELNWNLVVPVAKSQSSGGLLVAIISDGKVKRIGSIGSYKEAIQLFGTGYIEVLGESEARLKSTLTGLTNFVSYGFIVSCVALSKNINFESFSDGNKRSIDKILQKVKSYRVASGAKVHGGEAITTSKNTSAEHADKVSGSEDRQSNSGTTSLLLDMLKKLDSKLDDMAKCQETLEDKLNQHISKMNTLTDKLQESMGCTGSLSNSSSKPEEFVEKFMEKISVELAGIKEHIDSSQKLKGDIGKTLNKALENPSRHIKETEEYEEEKKELSVEEVYRVIKQMSEEDCLTVSPAIFEKLKLKNYYSLFNNYANGSSCMLYDLYAETDKVHFATLVCTVYGEEGAPIKIQVLKPYNSKALSSADKHDFKMKFLEWRKEVQYKFIR